MLRIVVALSGHGTSVLAVEATCILTVTSAATHVAGTVGSCTCRAKTGHASSCSEAAVTARAGVEVGRWVPLSAASGLYVVFALALLVELLDPALWLRRRALWAAVLRLAVLLGLVVMGLLAVRRVVAAVALVLWWAAVLLLVATILLLLAAVLRLAVLLLLLSVRIVSAVLRLAWRSTAAVV